MKKNVKKKKMFLQTNLGYMSAEAILDHLQENLMEFYLYKDRVLENLFNREDVEAILQAIQMIISHDTNSLCENSASLYCVFNGGENGEYEKTEEKVKTAVVNALNEVLEKGREDENKEEETNTQTEATKELINIHGMSEEEAKSAIEKLLSKKEELKSLNQK